MTKLLFARLLLISLISYGQSDSSSKQNFSIEQDSIEYKQRGIEFIKQIEGQSLASKDFILADKPFSFEYYDCISELVADTATFTKDELSFLKGKKFSSISKWMQNIFPNIKIVSSDTLKAIFNDHSKWWTYFYKNVGHSFTTFSFPIFLRGNEYCLFYSDYHCGGLCGRGRLTLYKKDKDGWVEVKSYCNWIS